MSEGHDSASSDPFAAFAASAIMRPRLRLVSSLLLFGGQTRAEDNVLFRERLWRGNSLSVLANMNAKLPKPKKTRAQLEQEIVEAFVEGGAYMSPEGIVDGETLLEIIRQSPGVFDLMVLSAMIYGDADLHTDTESKYHKLTEGLVAGLASVIMEAAEGSDRAAIQLTAIEKFIKPEKFELPLSKIEEIANRYETSPPLARGWELLSLMSALSNVIERSESDDPCSYNKPIKLGEAPTFFYYEVLRELAERHWTTNATLQSLAIRIYLAHLRDEGITDDNQTITARTLKRDLEIARKWEQDATEDQKNRRGRLRGAFSSSPIGWYGFSDGWKTRKKALNASRKVRTKKGRQKLKRKPGAKTTTN